MIKSLQINVQDDATVHHVVFKEVKRTISKNETVHKKTIELQIVKIRMQENFL